MKSKATAVFARTKDGEFWLSCWEGVYTEAQARCILQAENQLGQEAKDLDEIIVIHSTPVTVAPTEK